MLYLILFLREYGGVLRYCTDKVKKREANYIYSVVVNVGIWTSVYAHSVILDSSAIARTADAWFCNKWRPMLCTNLLVVGDTGPGV